MINVISEDRPYKVLNNQPRSYLKDLIVPYHLNGALHSDGLLVVPRTFKSRT